MPNGQTNKPLLGKLEILVQGLIILSLVNLAFETLPDLSPKQQFWIRFFEVTFVILFTVEYLTRLTLSHPKKRYPLSFFGIVDLLAILPFYLGLGVNLHHLRILRMFRLFRILKLARYNNAIRRFHRAFLIAKEEIILFLIVSCILLYFAGMGIYFFEHPVQPEAFRSMFDGLWWAVVTLTTVGFGDIYPITVGGKMFTVLILAIGLGIIAVPTGMFASALAKAREEEGEENSVRQTKPHDPQ